MRHRCVLALSLALISVASPAAPAAWYQWRSLADGALFCAQTQPGPKWEKFAGPFDNAGCKSQRSRSLL